MTTVDPVVEAGREFVLAVLFAKSSPDSPAGRLMIRAIARMVAEEAKRSGSGNPEVAAAETVGKIVAHNDLRQHSSGDYVTLFNTGNVQSRLSWVKQQLLAEARASASA